MGETPRTERFRITVTERRDEPLGGWATDNDSAGVEPAGVDVPRTHPGATKTARSNALSPLED